MTVRSIRPAEGTKFWIEVARTEKTPGYTIQVDAQPAGITVPELWRSVFARQVRRGLLMQGVDIDVPGRDRIVRQCLADAGMRKAVIGKSGPWGQGGLSEHQGLAKLRSWGMMIREESIPKPVILPPPPTAPDSDRQPSTVEDYRAAIRDYRPNLPDTAETAGGVAESAAAAPEQKEVEKPGGGWLKWLLGVIVAGTLTSGIYLLPYGKADSPSLEGSTSDETLKAEVNAKLKGIWSNCLKTNNDLTLEEAMGVENFREQREDFEQHANYLSGQYQRGQLIPSDKAKKYLASNMERYNKLCRCTTVIDCND